MKGYTRPPGIFQTHRERKFNEATSRVQYNRTLYWNETGVPTVDAVETTIFSLVLPPGLLAGNGESLYFNFWVSSANNANAKTIRIKINSTTILSFSPVWDGANPSPVSVLTGHIYPVDGPTLQYGNVLVMSTGLTVLTSHSTGAAAEDLSAKATLSVTGQGVASGDLRSFVGKVEFSPAP